MVVLKIGLLRYNFFIIGPGTHVLSDWDHKHFYGLNIHVYTLIFNSALVKWEIDHNNFKINTFIVFLKL